LDHMCQRNLYLYHWLPHVINKMEISWFECFFLLFMWSCILFVGLVYRYFSFRTSCSILSLHAFICFWCIFFYSLTCYVINTWQFQLSNVLQLFCSSQKHTRLYLCIFAGYWRDSSCSFHGQGFPRWLLYMWGKGVIRNPYNCYIN